MIQKYVHENYPGWDFIFGDTSAPVTTKAYHGKWTEEKFRLYIIATHPEIPHKFCILGYDRQGIVNELKEQMQEYRKD